MSKSNNNLELFIISDSLGETGTKVSQAVLAQFPTLTQVKLTKFPFVATKEELLDILRDAYAVGAIVVITLSTKELNEVAYSYAKIHDIELIDYMSPLVQAIQVKSQVEPAQRPRAQYQLNQDYFDRIAAIEFAVKYDDGKDPRGFEQADIVLLGISRTSKTPVSMYLAYKGYKVANLPLIPGIPIPKELYQVPSERLIGLLSTPNTIMKFRQSRLMSLGLPGQVEYSEFDQIKEEIRYSQEVFEKVKAEVIQVNHLAIEETAQKIEMIMQQRKAEY